MDINAYVRQSGYKQGVIDVTATCGDETDKMRLQLAEPARLFRRTNKMGDRTVAVLTELMCLAIPGEVRSISIDHAGLANTLSTKPHTWATLGWKNGVGADIPNADAWQSFLTQLERHGIDKIGAC